MQRIRPFRLALAVGVLALSIGLFPQQLNAQAAGATYELDLDVASRALKQSNYDRAIARLEAGLERAESEQNRSWESTFNFQLALTLQQRGLALQQTAADRDRAINHYERHLAFNASSGSAMNNLAQLYTEAGRIEDATRLYREAIALEDERKGFYALNLADMLMQQGNPKSAITFYRITLEEHPDHPDAQEGLIAAYQAADLPGLVTHLWDQIDRGRQVRATLASLQVLNRLADDEDRPGLADEKTELLTCVVVGLSKAQYGPLKSGDGSMKKGDIEQLLGALANDPDIGAGVTEVLQVYDNPNISPDGRSWWASLGTRERDPDEGWWPRDGYRMLLRSLGAWYARRDWPDIAEAYYRRSVELTANSDNEPDLEALVRLADLFMEQGDIDRVRDLLEASDTELYYGKGQAYRTSSWKKVYAFHRTLGIMYALTENWGASNDVTSATFQLENALEKRELYNRRFGREEDDTLIPLEPRLVNLLAQTYNATGRADEAVPLQLDSAEELFRADTPAGARQILDAMDVSKLDNPSRRRYQALQRRLP